MLSQNKYSKRSWNDSESDDERTSKRRWKSSSDDDDDFPRGRIARAPRNFRFRFDHLERWNDEEFRMRFRLNKTTVSSLEGRIGSELESRTKRNHPLSAMQKILLLLRFCATGCMLQTIGDFCGIHKSTASQAIRQVLGQLVLLSPEYIKMPKNGQDLESVTKKFHDVAKFPRTAGAIDCTHIKIFSPGGDNAEYFRNRKGFFSLNVQVIGDPELYIRDIVARWPGSTHDQTIFSNSYIRSRFESGEFGNSVLIGDSGYSVRNYMMTPIHSPRSDGERLFNEAHVRSRNCIERLFGVWKRRFPVLALGIRLKLETTKSLIVACAVLHNIAVEMREAYPIDDPTLSYELEEIPETNIVNTEPHNVREQFVLYFFNLSQLN